MSQQLMDVVTAFHDLEVAVIELKLAEMKLSDEHSSVLAVVEGETKIKLAAQRLTRAIDSLPMDKRPKGWLT